MTNVTEEATVGEMMERRHDDNRLMAQWIVSLAVSVVCCAVLFIVFAGYIVDLHEKLNLTTVRLEVAQEKLSTHSADIENLRRIVMPAPQRAQKAEPASAVSPDQQNQSQQSIDATALPVISAPEAPQPATSAAPKAQ